MRVHKLAAAARTAIEGSPFRILSLIDQSRDTEHPHLVIELATPDGRPARLELIEHLDGERRYWYDLHSENRGGARIYQGFHLHRERPSGQRIAHHSARIDGTRAGWRTDRERGAAEAITALLADYKARERLSPAPVPARAPNETMRAYRRRKLAALTSAA